jgi:hypothetical protein
VIGNGDAQAADEGEEIGVAAHVFEFLAFGFLGGVGQCLLLLSRGAGGQEVEKAEGEIDD